MFRDKEMRYQAKHQPNKTNIDPWNPENTIECAELVERYHMCVENMRHRNARNLLDKCSQLQKFSLLCYKLEPKYFKHVVDSELTEEFYFEKVIYIQYMNKEFQEMRATSRPNVWKMREKKESSNN